MVKVPVSGPVAAGEKVTLMVQEALAATLLPQLLVSPKLALVAMLVVRSELAPVLLRVTDCGPLAVPRLWLLNVRLGGETLATGFVASPVPVKLNACELLAALSVRFREALRFPVAVGLNVTLTVQVLLGKSGASVQVSELMPKSPAFVPSIATVEILRLAVPVLVTATLWGALVWPIFCTLNVRLVGSKLTVSRMPVKFATKASVPPGQSMQVPWMGLAVGNVIEDVDPVK
jgi:hypothetical protein